MKRKRTTEKHLPIAGFGWASDKTKMKWMLYKNLQRKFTYGAKIVLSGMKVLDTINTERETENKD